MVDRYASLKQGLVGCWIPSVSGSGLLLPDLSGRGNNGSLVNMDASDWVSGQYGRALDFDGTDDVVSLGVMPPAVRNLPLRDFSISFFCNPRSQGENSLGTIIDTYDTGAAGWYVLLRGVSGASYAIQSGVKFFSTDLTHVSGNDFFAVNRFDHVIVVFRNATKDLLLYRNGVAINFPQTSTASGAYNDDSSQAFRVGNRNAGDRTWDGQLDDIRIYNRALTESEIRLLSSEPGIGFKPAKKLSRFSQRFTYKPPKAKVFEGVRVRDHDYASLRQGLVGAWCPSLPNGGSGNTLPDVSGYGNHGTLTNMGPEDWVSGQYGRALDFDGVNDYIEIPSASQFRFGNGVADFPFSVSFWLNKLNFVSGDFIGRNNANASQRLWRIILSGASDQFLFILYDQDVNNYISAEVSPVTIDDGLWHHVCCTYSGNRQNTGLNIYFDGREQSVTRLSSGTYVAMEDFEFPIWIGRVSTLYSNFTGDDTRIYNRELSITEIRLLASRPSIGLQPSPTRFIAREKKTGLRRKILTGQT